MNCKPGDLAVVVSFRLPEDECLLGKVRRVIAVDPSWHLPAWTYEGARIIDDAGFEIAVLADMHLRPIRGGETPEESAEAMKRLHDTSAPARKKEPVVRPFEWEKL